MLLDITDVAEKLLIKVRFGIFIRKVPKNMWTLLQNMLKVHAVPLFYKYQVRTINVVNTRGTPRI